MSEEKKEIKYTTSELLQMKEEYDTPEKYEEFIQNYVDKIADYDLNTINWSEWLINDYLMKFGDKVSTKIIKHGEVVISCGEKTRDNNQKITYCTITPEGQIPTHLGFEVPKELFKDFVMHSLSALTNDEVKKIKEVKIIL